MARWTYVNGELIPATGPPGPGLVWRGEWESTNTYIRHDIVHYEGDTYIAIEGNTDEPPLTGDATPVESPSWDLFVAGGTGGGGTIGDEDSILLRSPDESIWRITVADDGALSTEEVIE
jgi:hypothetical protein